MDININTLSDFDPKKFKAAFEYYKKMGWDNAEDTISGEKWKLFEKWYNEQNK